MAPEALTRGARSEASDVEQELTSGDIQRRAASGAALLTAKGVIAQILGLLSTIVVTRLLVPHQLGMYAIAMTISTFLLVLGGGVGMGGALIRNPAPLERADLRAFLALQLIVSSVLVAAVAAATEPFGLIGHLTAVMVLSALVTAVAGASAVVLERQLLYKPIAVADTAAIVTFYGWTVVTVALGWGLWGLATATLARAVVWTAAILTLAPTRIVLPRFDRRRIRAMLDMGLRVQAVELVTALRDQFLVLGTAAIGSISIVAYWSLVLRALQAPQTLLLTLLRVSFPAMSRTRSAGGDPAAMLPRLLPAATFLTGMLLAPLAGAAPALVPFLFGERWSPAADALSLACVAVIVHTPVLIAAQSYLWTAGDAKSPLRATIADAVVVIAVGLPLVPLIGVLGLAVGGVACAIVHTAILARAVDRQTHVRVVSHIRTPVLAWLVAVGAAWACAQAPGPPAILTVLTACLAIGLYLGVLFLTRRELMVGLARQFWPLVRGRLFHRPAPAAA